MFLNWFKRKGKRKGRTPKVLFEGFVKRMDVRRASFIWLQDKETGKDFFGDMSIQKVIIDLPDGVLSKKVHTKTEAGAVKLKLRTILEKMTNKKRSFKLVQFKRPVHVRIYGIPEGDVEITFSMGEERRKDEEE